MVTPTETKKIKRLEVEVNLVYSLTYNGNQYSALENRQYEHTYANRNWIINNTYGLQTYHGTITSGRLIREDDTWVDVTPTNSNHRAYWQCTFGHQNLPFLLYYQWLNIQNRAIDADLIRDWEAMCATFNWPPWKLEFYRDGGQNFQYRIFTISTSDNPLFTFPRTGTLAEGNAALAAAPVTPDSPYSMVIQLNRPTKTNPVGWMVDAIVIPAFGIGNLAVEHSGEESSTFTTVEPDNWQFHYETFLAPPLNRIHDVSRTHHEFGHTTLHRANSTPRIVDDNPQTCLLYTSPSPRDRQKSRMPSSA